MEFVAKHFQICIVLTPCSGAEIFDNGAVCDDVRHGWQGWYWGWHHSRGHGGTVKNTKADWREPHPSHTDKHSTADTTVLRKGMLHIRAILINIALWIHCGYDCASNRCVTHMSHIDKLVCITDLMGNGYLYIYPWWVYFTDLIDWLISLFASKRREYSIIWNTISHKIIHS